MKKILIILAIVVLVVVTAAALVWVDHTRPLSGPLSSHLMAAPAEKMVPDFSVTSLRGHTVNIRDLRGRVVIINFWATWCPPCVVEMPLLIDLATKYDGRVVLIALSSDQQEAMVKKFIGDLRMKENLDPYGPNVIMAMDKGRALTRDVFRVTTYPESLIIAPNGQIARHIIGITPWEDGSAEKTIQALLPYK